MTDSSTLFLRPAEAQEFAAVGDLTARAFAAGPYGHLPRSPEREAFERDAGARAVGGALLVAVTAVGEIVGSSTLLRADSPHARVARAGEAEIRLLSVDPERQGAGAGAALVAASIAEARGWGVHAVVLDTGSLNVGAQRLYLRAGFTRVVERAPVGDQGEGVRSFVYSYDLGDAAGERHDASGDIHKSAGDLDDAAGDARDAAGDARDAAGDLHHAAGAARDARAWNDAAGSRGAGARAGTGSAAPVLDAAPTRKRKASA